MMSFGQFEFRQMEHERAVKDVDRNAWRKQDVPLPPTVLDRIRKRVSRR